MRSTWHYYQPPHRFLTIRHATAIYVKHSPRSDIKKYAVLNLLITLIKKLIMLIRVIIIRVIIIFLNGQPNIY